MSKIDLSQHNFQFTKNWFNSRNRRTFQRYVVPVWKGKPITYMEIGVWEGMSLCFMLQNVLTHPQSKAIAYDPYLFTHKQSPQEMEAVMSRAIHNTEPWRDRCKLIRGCSADILRLMLRRRGFEGIKAGMVDLTMIDGNHNALAVLDDARLVYQLTRVGGHILFDDVCNDIKKYDHVEEGLAMWKQEMGDKVKFLWKHRYMEGYEKVS
jgi:hypothetical protein